MVISMKFQIISGKTLDGYLQKNKCLIIDLREKNSYEKGHISGAVWMDWEYAQEHIDGLVQDYVQENKHWPEWIILYCDTGSISLLIARDLATRGYPVMSLNGGYEQYVES